MSDIYFSEVLLTPKSRIEVLNYEFPIHFLTYLTVYQIRSTEFSQCLKTKKFDGKTFPVSTSMGDVTPGSCKPKLFRESQKSVYYLHKANISIIIAKLVV